MKEELLFSNNMTMLIKENHLDSALSIEERVEALLHKMTLEEKVAQLCSSNCDDLIALNEGAEQSAERFEDALQHGIGVIEHVSDKNTAEVSVEYINKFQRLLVEETRLGIPAIIGSECLHGHRAYNATNFPVPIAMANSWNPELINEAYDVTGREARARGAHEAHTPVLDLGRDPRWGRIEETFGEDAYLVSRMAVAAVSGLQGGKEGEPGSTHVVSSCKHFAGYGQVEGGRNFAPTYITPRVLRDEILVPFEAAIKEAGALGIMPSHCELDGIPAHGNKWLLTDLLRDELGFEGIVVSDYYDLPRLEEFHHVASSIAEASEMALIAGVDVDLPAGSAYGHLVDRVRLKPGLEKYVDRGVGRILRIKFMLGLFENPYADPEKAKDVSGCEAHRLVAKEVADESIVLLKNDDGILPLDKNRISRIAVVGPKASSKSLGVYSNINDRTVSILEGIEHEVAGQVEVLYEEGCKVGYIETVNEVKKAVELPFEQELESIARAVEAAKSSDVSIVCLGSEIEFSTEALYMKGHTGDRASLDLLGNQMELLSRVVATGKPVVVVLMHGRPLALPELAENVSAIMDVFYLGEALGASVSDAIFGKTNPSGKLSVSYPVSVGQLPVYYSQKGSAFLKEYVDAGNRPLFPFGHGLSYSKFEYSDLQLSERTLSSSGSLTFKFRLRNSGSVPGKEVVQVYIHDEVASVTRPLKQLIRFKKILVGPEEIKEVNFEISPNDLSFTGVDMHKVVEPGAFTLMVGSSSEDVRLTSQFFLE